MMSRTNRSFAFWRLFKLCDLKIKHCQHQDLPVTSPTESINLRKVEDLENVRVIGTITKNFHFYIVSFLTFRVGKKALREVRLSVKPVQGSATQLVAVHLV